MTKLRSEGEYIAKDAIRFERLLPGPIERVWDYLVDSEKRGKWLATGELTGVQGSTVELRFSHKDLTPHREEPPEQYKKPDGHTMIWTVKEFDPPKLLAVWWNKPGESEVKFELKPQGDKVLLTLTHSNVSKRDMLKSVSGGWHVHLDILASNLAGEVPGPFWAKLQKLWPEYDAKIPN